MHPLFVASIFVVSMASPAILAVKYAAKPRRELALGSGSAQRQLPRPFEGSVVFPGSAPENLSSTLGPRLLTPPTHMNQLHVDASNHQVQDGSGISREHSENAIELLAR